MLTFQRWALEAGFDPAPFAGHSLRSGLARETQAIQPAAFADRYAFADFGPAGGRLLVALSGPLCSVAKVAPLAAGEGLGAACSGTRLTERLRSSSLRYGDGSH